MEVEKAEVSPGADAGKNKLNFKVNDFEGPLDLLLKLLQKNGISIYDVAIASITEQFLEYLRCMETMDLDEASDFHATAALLLLIKSRSLLPIEMDDDGDLSDPRQELVDMLIEYQKFKKLSELMEEKEKEAEWIIERQNMQRNLPFNEDDLWEQIDVWSLMKTFSIILRKKGREQIDERIFDMHEDVTTNEKTALLIELLESKGECLLSDLIIRPQSIMEIVCSLLAILESVKIRMICIFQHRIFGDILIRPREN